MSTKALIGLKNEADGAVDFVSANFDGYLAHTGMILQRYWNSPERIGALLDEGKISSLGPDIGERHDGTKFPPEEGKGDYTVFYHRDRSQPKEETRPEHVESVDAYLTAQENTEYRYLYQDGQWFVSRTKHGAPAAEFRPLIDALGDCFATVEILSNGEQGFVLNVDISEDEEPNPGEKTPTVREITEFLDSNAGPEGWQWLIRKEDDLRLLVKVDAAVVALRLRYNIADHEDRKEAAA